MRKKEKLLALALLVCLNAGLLGLGLHLSWAFYKDTPDARKSAFRHKQTRIQRALKYLALYYREYDLHPDVSMRQARDWMQTYQILYTSLYTPSGNLLFRYYHRKKVPPELLEQVKKAFAKDLFSREDMQTPFLTWKNESFVLERHLLSVFNSRGEKEKLRLEYLWQAPEPTLSVYHRVFWSLKDFFYNQFGLWAFWVALLLCLIGGLFLQQSLQKMARVIYKIEEIPTLSFHKDAQIFQLHSEPALFENPFVNLNQEDRENKREDNKEENKSGSYPSSSVQNSLQKRLGKKEELRWNLPGFRNILPVPKLSGEDFLAKDYLEGKYESKLVFLRYDFGYARYLFGQDGIGSISSLSAWAHALLEKASTIDDSAFFTIYLRNRSAKLQAFLQKRGPLYISGESLPALPSSKLLEEAIEAQGSLIEKDTDHLWIALQDKGLLACQGGTFLRHTEQTASLQELGEDFGELLLQLQVFEAASCDPQSGFYNGLMLKRDMQKEFTLCQTQQLCRRLTLLYVDELENKYFSQKIDYFAQNLREFVGPEFSFYRIGQDLLALLGNPLSEAQEDAFVKGLEKLAKERLLPKFCVSWAETDLQTKSVDIWFENAWQGLFATLSNSKIGSPEASGA